MENLSLSVVVPTYGRPDEIPGMVESLGEQECPPDELLFVLRQGDRPTVDAVERASVSTLPFPVIRETVKMPGHLPPVRAGFCRAKSDVVALVDDDARPDANWGEGVLQRFSGREDLGVLAGRVVEPEVDHPDLRPLENNDGARSLPWPGRRSRRIVDRESAVGPIRATAAAGANLSIRRSTLGDLTVDMRLNVGTGRFYENDLCLQARSAGWEVLYDSDVQVQHYPSTEGRGSGPLERCRHAYTAGHNWTVVALKHTGPMTWLPFLAYWTLWGGSRADGLVRWLGVKAVADRETSLEELRWGLVGRVHGLWDVLFRDESYAREHPAPIRRRAR